MEKSTNLCSGCISRGRKGPCCWANHLDLTLQEYNQHFVGQIGVVIVRRWYDELYGQDMIRIHNPEACPKLDTDTGMCTIHDNKPDCCTNMTAGRHPLCCKAPDGRQ